MSYEMNMKIEPKLKQHQKQSQLLMMLPRMQQAIAFLQAPVQELAALVQLEIEQNPLLEQEERDEGEEIEKMQEEEGEESLQGDASETQEVAFDDHDFEVMKQLNEEYQDHFSQSNINSPRTREDDEYQTFLENSICEEITLSSYLMRQAMENFENEEDRRLAETIISSLDDKGFLFTSLVDLAALTNTTTKKLESVLLAIQDFDPSGVGARDLRESFLIQLRRRKKENSLSYKILLYHYDDLLHNRLPLIQKELGCTIEEIQQAVEGDIAKLDLRPGACFVSMNATYIVPDAVIHEDEGVITIELHNTSVPNFHVSSRYFKMMDNPEATDETKDYIRHHISSAKWLMRNIYQRNDTLTRVIESITRHQHGFLTSSEGQIKPLIMKEIAEELQLHESTIARTVAHKYVSTPRGVFSLRHFFSNSFTTDQGEELSSQAVRQAITKIVASEDKTRPLSDEKISDCLQEQGISCARRTVAKYRQLLKIGNTHQRKKYLQTT